MTRKVGGGGRRWGGVENQKFRFGQIGNTSLELGEEIQARDISKVVHI